MKQLKHFWGTLPPIGYTAIIYIESGLFLQLRTNDGIRIVADLIPDGTFEQKKIEILTLTENSVFPSQSDDGFGFFKWTFAFSTKSIHHNGIIFVFYRFI